MGHPALTRLAGVSEAGVRRRNPERSRGTNRNARPHEVLCSTYLSTQSMAFASRGIAKRLDVPGMPFGGRPDTRFRF